MSGERCYVCLVGERLTPAKGGKKNTEAKTAILVTLSILREGEGSTEERGKASDADVRRVLQSIQCN